MSQQKLAREEMFDSLIENAIDFFEKAISQLENKPKYSIINFWSGIELFLKSRLMWEHWALIISDIEEADLSKFKSGDFRSVNLDENIKRLKKISDVTIKDSTKEVFEDIKEHRNRVIHFFHEDLEEGDEENISEIACEQCRGWEYLYRLLTKHWDDIFDDYLDKINELNKKMRKKNAYLENKYNKIKSDIEKAKERGINFFECPFCDFEAYKQDNKIGPLKEFTCLVCDSKEEKLIVTCPECGEYILNLELGKGSCENCGHEIDLEFLISEYGRAVHPKDGVRSHHAYCSRCENYKETVVPINDKYLCLACLKIYNSIEKCEWCGENFAGKIEDTFLTGCVMCEGRLNW